jgi:hypothetical protein
MPTTKKVKTFQIFGWTLPLNKHGDNRQTQPLQIEC